jgi:hypothetical protein
MNARYFIQTSAVDAVMTREVEAFVRAYEGNSLLHDIELTFPGLSYRAFFLGFMRASDPLHALRCCKPEGTA